MLLKALQYFIAKFWEGLVGFGRASDANELERVRQFCADAYCPRSSITRISGETYWIYRLYAEGLLIALACLGLLVALFMQESTAAMQGFFIASFIAIVVGMLELLRLSKLLNEQITFAEQFYG